MTKGTIVVVFVILLVVIGFIAVVLSEENMAKPLACSTYADRDTGYVPVRCLKYFEGK